MSVQVDDRRIFDRFTARFPVKLKDSRDDYGSNVFLRDVSAEGAKVSTKENLFVNDKVEFLVELPDGKEPLSFNGHVVWVHGLNPQLREAGVRFEKIDFMDTQRIFKFCQ